MTWLLVMVLEIFAAMAVGFVLGRIWQIRCDADDFTTPTIGRIPTSCATATGGRLYYWPSAMPPRCDKRHYQSENKIGDPNVPQPHASPLAHSGS